jgi:SAM-dependent methyltransferase
MNLLSEICILTYYHTHYTRRRAEYDAQVVFEKTLRDLAGFGFGELSGKRVIDLGCGQRYAFALQCAAAGAQATALDVECVAPAPLPAAFYRTLRRGGFKRAVKSLLRRLFCDRRYYRLLEQAAGKKLLPYNSAVHFVLADPAAAYPLPAHSFDLIASNLAVEHIADIPALAVELARLLDPNGLFYAIIHNFFSLSGGHNLEWVYPDEQPSKRVPPWDHLRHNRYPGWQYLNRLRPEEYQRAFGDSLDILLFEGRDVNHEPGILEGERYLTPEVEHELAAYPRSLLLTRHWCLVARAR